MILISQSVISVIIYRIIRFHSFLKLYGILPTNYCFGTSNHFRAKHLKMFMFNHPSIRYLTFCIIYDCITLIIGNIKRFRFKFNGAILQFTITILIIFIYRSGKNDFIRYRFSIISVSKKICINQCIYPFKQTGNQLIESSDRNPLIFVIEIIVVKH